MLLLLNVVGCRLPCCRRCVGAAGCIAVLPVAREAAAMPPATAAATTSAEVGAAAVCPVHTEQECRPIGS